MALVDLRLSFGGLVVCVGVTAEDRTRSAALEGDLDLLASGWWLSDRGHRQCAPQHKTITSRRRKKIMQQNQLHRFCVAPMMEWAKRFVFSST
jgi:hypothetical protein